MTQTPSFLKGSTIRRNGSKLAGPNTFVVTQVHVNESGKLLRYIARNPGSGAVINIYAREEGYWHFVA